MDRRSFVKIVGATGAVIAVNPSLIKGNLFAADGSMYSAYEKVKLIDKDGKAITADSLKKEATYVFNYPYVSTPAFLIKLPKATNKNVELQTEEGEKYVWSGAAGKNNDIVGFSAICAHALTHPNPIDSFMKYVPENEKTMAHSKGGVIVCSSHLSVYDPLNGAKNLSGEAKQPLASVVLEVSDDGSIYAVGVLGGAMFQSFFKGFKPELKERYGSLNDAKKMTFTEAKTVVLEEYTKEIIAY